MLINPFGKSKIPYAASDLQIQGSIWDSGFTGESTIPYAALDLQIQDPIWGFGFTGGWRLHAGLALGRFGREVAHFLGHLISRATAANLVEVL